jgi:hypothetical protein
MTFVLKRRDGRDIAKNGTVPFKTGRMASLVSEPSLMSQVGGLREVVCAYIGVFLQSAVEVRVVVSLRSSCNHVTNVGEP